MLRPRFARVRLVFGAVAGIVLAGCLDLRLSENEAPTVAGLPAGEGWVALPVGLWMTEGDVQALAISACLERACRHQGVVGLFRARGREGARAEALARDPAALAAFLSHPSVRPARSKARPAPPVQVATEVRPSGTGFAVRMSGAGDRHVVWSEVRVRPETGGALVLIALGDDRAFIKDVVERTQASTGSSR